MKLLSSFYNYLLSPALLVSILIAGVYISLRLSFFFLRHPLRVLRDLFCPEKGKHSLSSWKALTVALAGTLGVGNIAGVAAAITAGGPGAVFWMWIGALVSMLIKYSEVVLAIRYRVPDGNRFIGGAMYYFSRRSVGMLFSLLCLFASFALGNILQVRTVAVSVEEAFGVPPIACGILVAFLLYLTICRGFSRISSVTICLVPLMSALYIGICVIVIGQQISELPAVIAMIFRNAFSPSAALGGVGGLSLAAVIRAGVSRGLITHEAGCGTAPMAHASAETNSPVRQGFLGIFEVFADTMILCSLTAFVVLLNDSAAPSQDGMELVIACFAKVLGNAAPPILSILIFCFALATMIGWSYYGKMCLQYLCQNLRFSEIYKKLYAIAYSLVAILGAMTAGDLTWILADYAVASMTLIHLPCLLSKIKEVADLTRAYFSQSARKLENTSAPDAASAASKDTREIL